MKIQKSALIILLVLTIATPFHSTSAKDLKPTRQYFSRGNFGAVATGHPLATKAAKEILKNGGNAIDAAVCAAYVLGVTDFTNSGIGGDGYALVRTPNGSIISWDASIRKPANFLQNKSYIGFPTEVKLLSQLLSIYGTQNISMVIKPAILCAENGFQVTSYLEQLIKKKLLKLKDEKAISLLCKNNRPILAGEILKQPMLANTLKIISKYGANEFYRGQLSRTLVKHMQRLGSSYSESDFYSYNCKPEKAISVEYEKYRFIGVPPPSSSIASIAIAKLLLNSKLDLFPKTLLEIEKLAKLINNVINTKHLKLSSYLYKPMSFLKLCEEKQKDSSSYIETNANTTHLCVWDNKGYVISMTLTLGSHCGTGDLSPLGFFYNNEMRNYQPLIAKYPSNYPDNAGPISSKSPVMVLRNNQPILSIGGAGSDRIIANVGLIIARIVSSQGNLLKSVHEPRFFLNYKQELVFEWSPNLSNILKSKQGKYKQVIKTGGNDYFGLVTAIGRTKNTLEAVADFRRDGCSETLNAFSSIHTETRE